MTVKPRDIVRRIGGEQYYIESQKLLADQLASNLE